jgi:serine/threonine-protein kinase
MGATPKVEIPLSAGTHTVTFVHPDLGKKSVSVTIKAGQSATASVRFKK